MNILQVSTTEALGQAFNGYLLNHLLRSNNHKADMAVFYKLAEGNYSFQLGSEELRRLSFGYAELEGQLSLQNTMTPLGLDLLSHKSFHDADVVHLQLVQSSPFFSLFMLPLISKFKPMVLSIHDLWFITGHCIHPLDCDRWKIGCGMCPDLKRLLPIKNDLTRFNWLLKKDVYSSANFEVVVASPWLLSRLEASPLLVGKKKNLIPFGYDQSIFKAGSKGSVRRSLGIDDDSHVIFFRNLPSSDFKGIEYIEKALARFSPQKKTYIVTVQEIGGFNELQSKYTFLHQGEVKDPKRMASLYTAADVFLMPSIAETFGMMALESIACGTPVIYFEGTALSGIVSHGREGLAAEYKNSDDLANKLMKLLSDPDLRERYSKNGIEKALMQFPLDNYREKHETVYKRAIKEFHDKANH